MKRCFSCSRVLDLEEFSWHRKEKGTRQSSCRDCQKVYRKAHYQANRDKYIAKAATWRQKTLEDVRPKLIEYFKAHPCQDCGETNVEVLEFDHRDPTMKEFNVAFNLGRVKWEVLLKEIEKCDVVCANDHRRRTNRQFGYWRTLVSEV